MVAVSDGKDPKKAGNNNKYYEMVENGSNFDVTYGRVDTTAIHETYPMSRWDSKYKEKLKKGYKDITHTVMVVQDVVRDDVKVSKIDDAKVDNFLNLMKKYTDGLVAQTYTVKAQSVTQTQVDNAQDFLDRLKKLPKKDKTGINALLLELYMEIPRRMQDVRDYLVPKINLDKVLEQEQDNLDAMASQVSMLKDSKQPKVKKEKNTLLDILGITMKEIQPTKEIEYLIKQLNSGRNTIKGVFEIQKKAEDIVFDKWLSTQKNKDTRVLIHGTKCTSVIPIIEQGLKIRPAGNYQFSGKVYGDGNYFSETCSKSLNYTGYDNDSILLVYEVHVGKPFIYEGWYTGNTFSLTYKNLQDRGFDTTFVKAGGGLLNSEIIAYKEQQCRLKYIIHTKR